MGGITTRYVIYTVLDVNTDPGRGQPGVNPGLADLHFDAVPGPIVGAGLPGLILAAGGLFGWRLRKQRAEAAA
jgi:hypothetical protein